MRAVKRRKRICLILTAMMMMFGMCFEKVNADSFFALGEDGDSAASICASLGIQSREDPCTERLLGHRAAEQIVECGKLQDREETEESELESLFSCGSSISVNNSRRFVIANERAANADCGRDALIWYIHHQDGGKN